MKRHSRNTVTHSARAKAGLSAGKRKHRPRSRAWPRIWAGWGALLAALCLAWLCGRASASMTDCLEATCRITAPDGSRGTGCVFEINHGQVYILTVAHVVGQHAGVECEFWRNGHQSQPLAGRVLSRTRESQGDAAIVAVEIGRFGGVLPTAVPVASPRYTLRAGDPITSAGCPNGAWSTGWKGHVVRTAGGDLHFVPPPAQGRSGSAIFDAEGQQIIGLLRARTIDNQEGIACSVQSLYQQLGYPTAERQTQCGPGGCTGGSAPDYRVLPYRQKQEFEQWRSNNSNSGNSAAGPWPTLPANERLDLNDTNRRLDRIADLLQMRTPAAAEKPAPADPRSEAAEKTAKEAQNAAAEVKQEQSKLREHLGGLQAALEKLVGDPTSLPDRIHARLEKVKGEGAEGTREIVRAYVRDFVGEKLEDHSLGLGLGKTLGGMLGLSGPLALALGGGLWLIARQIGPKIAAGEPLAVQHLFARLTDKIDDLKSRIQQDKSNG